LFVQPDREITLAVSFHFLELHATVSLQVTFVVNGPKLLHTLSKSLDDGRCPSRPTFWIELQLLQVFIIVSDFDHTP
jgi:hypothetical protein